MNKELAAALGENSRAVDLAVNEIYSAFSDIDTDEVRNAELYSLTAGGKRIRAFLVNEFCRICGGLTEASMPLAAAIEMMHTFSLIHDDLPCMDNDDMRRGKPTSHKVFGEATALLAGDSLVIRSFLTIAENERIAPRLALKAVAVLAEATCSEGMIGGQIIDLRGEREKLDFDTLLKLHSKKTGALIIAAAKLGCIAAGVDDNDPRYNAAIEFARAIGLAFQIIDDILDATSSLERLGKNVGVDKDRNKTTFLSFMTIEAANEYARELTDKAKAELSVFNNNEMLCELADYLLTREK
jgi:geranylgeranyl diphosphate synthase type II